MKGLVFTLLEEVVGAAYGEPVWTQLLRQAGARGPYVAGADYPDGELTRLVAALADATGRDIDEVTQWFRRRAHEQLAQDGAVDLETFREAAERASALLAEALDAGDAERARLAATLHEGTLQTLMAVRQDVLEAVEGDPSGLPAALEALDAAVAEVRGLASWLHPVALDHVGLATTLVTTLQADARERGIEVEVDAEGTPRGTHDAVLLAVARDIVGACDPGGRVAVRLRREDGASVLELRPASRCLVPPRTGQRVASVGGTLTVEDGLTVARVPFEPRTTMAVPSFGG